MIETTFNAQDVFILNESPNFRFGYQSDFDSPTDLQRSLTTRETRRPFGSSLRVATKFVATVTGSSLRTLQGVLRGLKAQPVLAPFWPAVSFWSDRGSMVISGGLLVAFKPDWSQYEVYESGNDPVWPLATDYVAPMMLGFIKPEKEFSITNVDTAQVKVEFQEASDLKYALVFNQPTLTSGPTPTGYDYAPKLAPSRPNFKDTAESLTVDVAQDQLGYNRKQVKTFYTQDVYRVNRSSYTLKSQADVAAMISWYDFIASQGQSFWQASSLAIGYLASDSLAGDVNLTWSDANVQIGDFICTFLADGTLKFAKVQSLAGAVVTVAAAFGTALKAGQPFYMLSLARLEASKLSVKWSSTDVATVKLQWNEVRPEMLIAAGETLGTTLGALPERCILFDFWRDYGNGTIQHWYFTSYEDDINYNGILWKSGPFSVGDISSSLNLEDDSCEINTSLTDEYGDLFTASPVIKDISLTAEVPLNARIYFADVFQLSDQDIKDVGGDAIKDVGGSNLKEV